MYSGLNRSFINRTVHSQSAVSHLLSVYNRNRNRWWKRNSTTGSKMSVQSISHKRDLLNNRLLQEQRFRERESGSRIHQSKIPIERNYLTFDTTVWDYTCVQDKQILLKWYFRQKSSLTSFTQPHVIPNPDKNNRRCLAECPCCSFPYRYSFLHILLKHLFLCSMK